MRTRFAFLFALLIISFGLQAQLTLRIIQIPSNTPADPAIYVAGNFQGWNPGHPDYQLVDNGNGSYEITFSPNPGNLEFKFTRGSWGTVEGNANGGFLPNRTYNYDGNPTTEELTIQSWEDVGGTNSTATDNVQIYDTDFYIPQLDRYRRIWIYLPPDYDTSNKNYPVLYMHDGQNCFDESTSFAGEWEVDESLNQLFEEGDYGCIVVAIDNGGVHRTDELTPWNNPDYGGGQGDLYLQFIINSLKPVIDANFRTLPDREYTGIMGSSLGGLISHFALIKYQNVFSKGGVFSPAYWIVKDSIFSLTEHTSKEFPLKSYTIAGATEGGQIPFYANEMNNLLLNSNFNDEELFIEIHADGQHSEWYWAREFPAAYEWLFGDLNLTSVIEKSYSPIELFPNPSIGSLNIKNLEHLQNPAIEIVTMNGKPVVEKSILTGNTYAVSQLSSGIYVVKIWDGENVVFCKKWIRN